tara:strand:- start:9194 stop:9805 length:612 start_codon:yes stop_codon:yes gene_type:complete
MANFKDYTRFASSYCPNLPPMVFARAMLTAARQYFNKTQAWQETYEIALEPGIDKYETPLPYDCVAIDTIISATIDGKELKAFSKGSFPAKDGTPKVFMNPNKDTMIVWPIPTKDSVLEITYSLKPSIETEELPDGLFDEHFEGLLAGTIFELKRMPGVDWSDAVGANNFLAQFKVFMDEKRIELLHGNNNAELQIDYSKGNY